MNAVSPRKRSRAWSTWVASGSVPMAVLAVLALGATVLVAQRALSEASDVVVRGEADSLVSSVVTSLAEETSPPTAATLEEELAAHRAAGLRYIALFDREALAHGGSAGATAEAGAAELGDLGLRPGEARIVGNRVRVVQILFPPRRLPGAGPRAEPQVPPPLLPPRAGRPPGPGPAALVVELEPPVIAKLRLDLTRISVVGAVAGAVLLAFAVAFARSASKLAAVEQQAAREQRLVALGGMASVMAHELRNPLASLKGHAQLLAEDLESPKQRAKADRVVAEAERIELLTTSLLDFVRDGPMQVEAIAPAVLVAEALSHLPTDRIAVTLDGAPSTLTVDAPRLARAVHNLVDNALQAMSTKPHENENDKVDVRIVATPVEGGAVIRVRDFGDGLPSDPQLRAQIFEPFVTTRARGTGLGLAVARRIAEQHGGTLTGTNHPSGGAIFELRLPESAMAK